MWVVVRLEVRKHVLDFSSSGGGLHPSDALFADDTQLFNALELTSVEPDRTQSIICEECGTIHCKSGDWIQIRRVGTSIIFTPAFSEMEIGARERNEYSTPAFISSRGCPFFGDSTAIELVRILGRYDRFDIDGVPPLKGRDLCRTVQWEAPADVLGRYPDMPKVGRDKLIFSEPNGLERAAHSLDEQLEQLMTTEASLQIEPTGRAIRFYLEGTPAVEWSPMAISEKGAVQVRVSDRYSIARV